MKWELTLGGVVRTGRPLSAEAVRVAYRDLVQGEDEDGVLFRLLRKSFPLRWASLWDGDPVRLFLKHPHRMVLLKVLLTVPVEKVAPVLDKSEQDKEWDRIEAMQTIEETPGPVVTLDTVCRVTEAALGADWYFNRDRWATWDGYAPYDVVWRAWQTLKMVRAFDRMNMVRAIGITKAGPQAESLYDKVVTEALGG